jgi:hypothetical protein
MRIDQTRASALTSGPSATRRTITTLIFIAALTVFLSGNRVNAQAIEAAPVAPTLTSQAI